MIQIAILSVLAGLTVQPISAQRAEADPRLGTWKLNLAKSRYEGATPPTSETRTYVSAPDGTLTLTATTVLADRPKQAEAVPSALQEETRSPGCESDMQARRVRAPQAVLRSASFPAGS